MRWLSDRGRWVAFLLALLLPVLFWWQWLLPRQDALGGLRQDVEQLRGEARAAVGAEQRSMPQIQLAEVLRRLGTPGQLPQRVARLHDLLGDNGVVLLKAGYKLAPGGGDAPGRYEIQLEVEGPYYAIRLFARSMLLEDEAIALESLDLHRPQGSGGGIRAAMRWVMFVRETVSEAPP